MTDASDEGGGAPELGKQGADDLKKSMPFTFGGGVSMKTSHGSFLFSTPSAADGADMGDDDGPTPVEHKLAPVTKPFMAPPIRMGASKLLLRREQPCSVDMNPITVLVCFPLQLEASPRTCIHLQLQSPLGALVKLSRPPLCRSRAQSARHGLMLSAAYRCGNCRSRQRLTLPNQLLSAPLW